MNDLVSRQKAVNVILHYTLDPPYYMNEWAKRLIMAIKKDLMDDIEELPPAQQWIPVSERLPEEKINPNTLDFEEVLCSTTFGDVRAYKFGTPYGWEKPHFWLGGKAMDEYVLAWMPLPEPYKEGAE